MNFFRPRAETDLFRKMIIISLLLHLSFLLMTVIKSFVFPSEKIDFENAIRVDLVGLPDKIAQIDIPETVSEKTEPPPKPVESETKTVSKPETKIDEPTVVLKKEKPKNDAMAKVREMMKEEERRKEIAQITKQVAAEQAAKRQQIKNSLVRGNVISPGTALKGREKAEFDDYIGAVYEHVRRNWELPQWLKKEGLAVRVVVHLDYRGLVVRKYISKSSGDDQFDGYAFGAVDRSSPFPAPPAKFADVVKIDGLVLGFPE